MTFASPMLALIAIVFLAGCNQPLHSDMSFAEIRNAVAFEIVIGMEYEEATNGLKKLDLKPKQNFGEYDASKPDITASVPPKTPNPFDFKNIDDGQLRLYFDRNEQLRSITYLAPFHSRKQAGGWWANEPILLIGATP